MPYLTDVSAQEIIDCPSDTRIAPATFPVYFEVLAHSYDFDVQPVGRSNNIPKESWRTIATVIAARFDAAKPAADASKGELIAAITEILDVPYRMDIIKRGENVYATTVAAFLYATLKKLEVNACPHDADYLETLIQRNAPLPSNPTFDSEES